MTPSAQATAQDYGYYCWINHIVESEPEFGAMGFKGQFITVLPKHDLVIVHKTDREQPRPGEQGKPERARSVSLSQYATAVNLILSSLQPRQ